MAVKRAGNKVRAERRQRAWKRAQERNEINRLKNEQQHKDNVTFMKDHGIVIAYDSKGKRRPPSKSIRLSLRRAVHIPTETL
jgi:hypothetical protein